MLLLTNCPKLETAFVSCVLKRKFTLFYTLNNVFYMSQDVKLNKTETSLVIPQ